ncbi:RluA family pseudouridine synthase [Limibacter armeniacum]|uniref:RluA family pseudouridine synthase n=1 Tax=Limibacter armeniacum TaxID=466084 RepID=UPI002FE60687
MEKIETHIVPEGIGEIRFVDYAYDLFEALPSHNSVKKAIKKGLLHIDGAPAESGRWIMPGMCLDLYAKEVTPPKGFEIDLEIIYQDEHMVVVNKPAGIPTSGNQYRTLENALVANVPRSNAKNALQWAKPVHRLDSATSGLLIAARTMEARIVLGNMFKEKTIQKTYHALVIGETPTSGAIDLPIEEQKAYSEFKLLKRVRSIQCEYLSLLELKPHTGRTHQLRIHTSSLGFPILGDKLYGPEKGNFTGKGLFLSAVKLELNHPIDQKPIELSIPTPHKFESRMLNDQRRWDKYKG